MIYSLENAVNQGQSLKYQRKNSSIDNAPSLSKNLNQV